MSDERRTHHTWFFPYPSAATDRRGSYETGRRRKPRFVFDGTMVDMSLDAISEPMKCPLKDISAESICLYVPVEQNSDILSLMSSFPVISFGINGNTFRVRTNPRRYTRFDGYCEIVFDFLTNLPTTVLEKARPGKLQAVESGSSSA